MTGSRTDQLTTTEMYELDIACAVIRRAFGEPPYLVGSAAAGNPTGIYRDVDVRLILDDTQFAKVCPDLPRWELLCLAISAWLRNRTGLAVDFQIQRQTEANEKHPGPRNPLGLGRTYAGGGDATPPWTDLGW